MISIRSISGDASDVINAIKQYEHWTKKWKKNLHFFHEVYIFINISDSVFKYSNQ